MLAMILAVNILSDSGLLNYIINFLKPIFKIIFFPDKLIPLAFIRPISSSASLAFLNNIFELEGPDSHIGLMASVMQGSTDTTFYILALYFGSIGIKKVRYAYIAGLAADIIGIFASIILCKILF